MIVIILFILLMLAGTLLLQHRKNVDREQRKAEAIAALERVPVSFLKLPGNKFCL